MPGDCTIQTILDDVADSKEKDGSCVTTMEDQFYVEEDFKFQLLFFMMLVL